MSLESLQSDASDLILGFAKKLLASCQQHLLILPLDFNLLRGKNVLKIKLDGAKNYKKGPSQCRSIFRGSR